MVYIRGGAGVMGVARCVPFLGRGGVASILWMYNAFGILKAERKGRRMAFSFNDEHILTRGIIAVLAELDRAMPHWRMVSEGDQASERPPTHPVRTRFKNKRWRW